MKDWQIYCDLLSTWTSYMQRKTEFVIKKSKVLGQKSIRILKICNGKMGAGCEKKVLEKQRQCIFWHSFYDFILMHSNVTFTNVSVPLTELMSHFKWILFWTFWCQSKAFTLLPYISRNLVIHFIQNQLQAPKQNQAITQSARNTHVNTPWRALSLTNIDATLFFFSFLFFYFSFELHEYLWTRARLKIPDLTNQSIDWLVVAFIPHKIEHSDKQIQMH